LSAAAEERDDIAVISATTGEGVDGLMELVGSRLTSQAREMSFILPVGDGRRIAWLHAHGEIVGEEDVNDGEGEPCRRITVRLNPKELGQFESL
jgi:GTP-binding protein HflX